eukprot:gene13154-15533_t
MMFPEFVDSCDNIMKDFVIKGEERKAVASEADPNAVLRLLIKNGEVLRNSYYKWVS